MTAHPRSRGENPVADIEVTDDAGSSPLTRGKRHDEPIGLITDGLIPAHAGKTLAVPLVETIQRAHPRSRGENPDMSSRLRYERGSSPLTRGKHDGPPAPVADVRLIPAHAGKTPSHRATNQTPAAHPRSRGENDSMIFTFRSRLGSSPLTRGKPLHAILASRAAGLIPAHAGKTSYPSCRRSATWAHPRSRGENYAVSFRSCLMRGSSPLTRGKRNRLRCCAGRSRLIPAHAGKTLPDLRFYCADRSDLGNP